MHGPPRILSHRIQGESFWLDGATIVPQSHCYNYWVFPTHNSLLCWSLPSLEMTTNVTQVPRAAHRLPPKLPTGWWLLPGADQLVIASSTGGQHPSPWPPLNLSVSRRQVLANVNESRCQLGRLYLIAVDILPKSSIDIWVDDEGRMPRTIKTDNEVLRVRKL